MQKNVGGYDRIARLVVGPLLVVAGAAVLAGTVTVAAGTLGLAIGAAAALVGAVFVVTGYAQYCPLNDLLHLNTYRDETEPKPSETDGGRPS